MPALFKFADEHKAERDKFVILTLHVGRKAQTLAALEPRLAELEQGRWNGRKFPFPILCDSTGATVKAWQIEGYPTAALIDPDGNLVAKGHFKIEERLAEELKKRR